MPEDTTPKRPASAAALDFPIIFLLSANLGSREIQDLEDQIPTLTYDIDEAEVVLGKVFRKERALFELRKLKLTTEEVGPAETSPTTPRGKKRARLSAPELASSDIDSDSSSDDEPPSPLVGRAAAAATGPTIKVVKLPWLTDSIHAGEVLPLGDYIVYEGRKIPKTPEQTPQPPPAEKAAEVMKRALADASTSPRTPQRRSSQWRKPETLSSSPARPALLRETTPEHDLDAHLPPIPDYLHTTYSCQRPTPMNPPNEAFIKELAKIRTIRTLTGDKIGVRAYSTAIAAVAAYPYLLQTAPEVARLPGCGNKIAVLFQEFTSTGGHISEADTLTTSPHLITLSLFHSIWGVASTTAVSFHARGWRDLDDVVAHGWPTLTRVQQIGVKYHDELQQGIPRAEVEAIAATVLTHAEGLRPGYRMMVVGGYRRGKEESGDVDVLLSHPDEEATRGFVGRLVVSLEGVGVVPHTLVLSEANSERGQVAVSWKGEKKVAGTGFDTLDKAMVVWQAPGEEGQENPNPHRRVDIIISPWKTVGCAVLGWSGGTTFQRDLRRWCKKERGLKFDSSGVRSRKDGAWVDLESGNDGSPAPDMLTAERRVFERLGLVWRAPGERCTG